MRALIAACLLIATPAAAQVVADEGDERPSVIVMTLSRGESVPADHPETLAGLLTAALAKERRLRFISGQELNQLMVLEGEKARLGCDDDSCLADIAGALGARFAVGGSLTRLGELEVLQLRLMDVQRTESLARVTRNARNVESFVPLMDEVAQELLAPALARIARERGEPVADTTSTGIVVEQPETGPPAATDDEGSFLLSASLVGGGVALLGVAAVATIGVTAVDVAMIALVNPSLGPEDAVAPIVYVGAAALAAGGLALCLSPLLLGGDEEGS